MSRTVRQLTVRGIDKEMERRLLVLARQEGGSLNRAALKLMRRGAGLADAKVPAPVIGSDLDEHMGTWNEAEEREFLATIESCEEIDPSMWK